jgi:hypothetical protein
MKMRIYRCLLYHNAPTALDLFPGVLQMEKTSLRSLHNNAHAHRPPKGDRLVIMKRLFAAGERERYNPLLSLSEIKSYGEGIAAIF